MLKLIGILALSLGMAGGANAAVNNFLTFNQDQDHRDRDRHVQRAPEIDPAGAMAGLTLLAGGLAVLRGRRKK
jgi:LPXTG-motif cell wall-anchored protein